MSAYANVLLETTPLVKNRCKMPVTTYTLRGPVVTVTSTTSHEINVQEMEAEEETKVDGIPEGIVEAPDSQRDPVEDVGTILEEVVENVQEAAGTVLQELGDPEKGEGGLLELGLTRNQSILPSDAIHTMSDDPPPQDDLNEQKGDMEASVPLDVDEGNDTSKSPTVMSYIMLLVAVVSLSSVGPLLKLQTNVTATMKIQWRMVGTALFLFPFAAKEIYHQGFPQLSGSQWVTFLLSTVSYDILTLFFVLALDYTTVGNTVILANSWTLILLVGRLCVGDHVSWLETVSAMVAFAGCALCSKDSAEGRGGEAGHGVWVSLFGDALAIASAFGGVGYLIFAKACRQLMPLYTFMFLTMAVGCLLILPVQVTLMGEEVTFDTHPNHGVLGFLRLEADRLPLEFTMVVVCNMMGTMGYVQATQQFDTLVVSSGALLGPVTAEFLAFFLGVSKLPGVTGWWGNALVACGTFAVVYAGSKSSHEVKE